MTIPALYLGGTHLYATTVQALPKAPLGTDFLLGYEVVVTFFTIA